YFSALQTLIIFTTPLNRGRERLFDLPWNGVLHEFNSEWKTKDCQSCSCSKETMGCCSLVITPMDYDKEKCESIFYEETCSYKVVEKADPSKLCKVHGAVG
uniref:Microseminoprotein beta n=1 Tax=Terrapene triunguis TaxID=2587831 RepID=A0A674K069_9SAUR